MQIRFPGESAEYRTARDRLLEREIELRRAMEAVAAARRALPPGGAVPEDYVFEAAAPDGEAIQVRLSELFAPGKDSLVIYNFMFPHGKGGPRPGPTGGETALLPLEEGPCPSCTALLDQLDRKSTRLNSSHPSITLFPYTTLFRSSLRPPLQTAKPSKCASRSSSRRARIRSSSTTSCSRMARGDRVRGQPAVKRHCCHWRRARARPAPRCWIS